jgi:tetratricopeptide (TPR) repeat protein
MERAIDDVIETIKGAGARGRKCAVLIGSGCSVKAGIPTANGFVEIIRRQYPQAYNRAEAKTYPHCMAELAVAERRDLIAHYVDRAKINWAHICIAQLMKSGFIDRVLTTNFDMLVARACALVGLFPAVYDFAASQLFSPADIPEQAVFYLHGQRAGFVLLNTPAEVGKHRELLRHVFTDADRGRVWLVVGYSGENDPVFDQLARIERFDNNLYWIGHCDAPPPGHVRKRLLVDGKFAFFVPGYEADGFFVQLAQALNCFPPHFVSKPFSHMSGLLAELVPYSIPGQPTDIDVTTETREWIRAAISEYEYRPQLPTAATVDVVALQKALMAGDYWRVIDMYERSGKMLSNDGAEVVCWAYVMYGNRLVEDAKKKVGSEVDKCYAVANQSFVKAASLAPLRYEVLNSWGAAYREQADGRTPEEARPLLECAVEKHRKALEINPDDPWTLNNLGNALASLADTLAGDETVKLFEQAIDQYRHALQVAPYKHEVLNSWAGALVQRSAHKRGDEAMQCLEMAAEKYQASLQIKPDDHWTTNRLANVLLEMAERTDGARSEELFARALSTYEMAAHLTMDRHRALNDWGNALVAQAKRKKGKEATRAFELAEMTFRAALEAKPDYFWALNSWGFSLYERALLEEGTEAQQHFARAGEKFCAALSINPYDYWSLHNWGNVLSHEATFKDEAESARLFALAEEKFQAALEINDKDCWTLHHWGRSLMLQAARARGERAARLFDEARRKLEAAESLKSGCSAYELARLFALCGQEEECRNWLKVWRRESAPPETRALLEDSAFRAVRDRPWFGVTAQPLT